MKMFHISDPWDYHEYGGYVILAESAEDAVEKLKEFINNNPEVNSGWRDEYAAVKFDTVTEITGNVYSTPGCDC